MRTAATLALASSLFAAAQAGHQPAIARNHLHRRADSSTATAAATAHATGTANTGSETVTAKATATSAAATASALPLTEYTYAYSDVPYQVNPYKSARGPQSGYNVCNSTTLGADSNYLCLWGLPGGPDDLMTIGDAEAATVAYCTKNTHGTRIIPGGAITGIQFMRTKAYIQITGYIDQTTLGLTKNDTGGELDPHGADLLGNPLGGLVYSTGLPSGDNKTYTQAVEWNNFVGGGYFCLKLCDPVYSDGNNYCENRYDLMGCNYNMPSAVKDGEFASCEGDLQDVVGIYTSSGKVMTYTQPAEGASINPPYTPRIPSSSNCQTYASTDLFVVATTTSGSSAATATGKITSGASGAAKTGTGAGASSTGSSTSGTASLAVGPSVYALVAAVALFILA
ncbi:hypothetical protein JCM5296_004875 [Sporobolomyces johnsonii]